MVAHSAQCDGKEIVLTSKEFQLLEALVRNQGSVLSKERLAQVAWERDLEPEVNTVEVHISSLRRKLGIDLIHTLRGVGYVIRVPG